MPSHSGTVVVQRVKSASVTVDSELISSIGKGLLVLAGVGKEDTEKEAEQAVNKVLKAKFWPDENGAQVSMCREAQNGPSLTGSQWKKNVQDIESEVLCGMMRCSWGSSQLLTTHSIAVYPLRQVEKGKQTRLSRCRRCPNSTSSLRPFLQQDA